MITIPQRPILTKPDPEEIRRTQMANISKSFARGKANESATAIGELLRHHGMSHVAEVSGIGRAVLYRSFGKTGNPTLQVLLNSLKAVGLTLEVKKIAKDE